jgi:acyl carrier protein
MTAEETLDAFTEILQNLLGDDSIVLTPETRRPDVPGWDSFNYVNFIVAIEMKFGVKFGVAEVESFQSVGEIVQRTLERSQGRRT